LAEANNRRQEVSVQLGNVKNERSQLLAERNVLKARCRDFEKKDEDSQAALERLEEELAAEKKESTKKAGQIYQLEGYVMSQHEEGFYKAMLQASHYFNFDMGGERFDIDKDVYEGSVITVGNRNLVLLLRIELLLCIFWFYKLFVELWLFTFWTCSNAHCMF